MRLPILSFLLLIMPLAEIAGFVIVGKVLGVWATLGLVILTSIAGAVLLRIQGIGMLRRISTESREGAVPGRELIHGAMIVIAAILLLLPGFITDALGLLLFIPPVRDLIWSLIGKRVIIV